MRERTPREWFKIGTVTILLLTVLYIGSAGPVLRYRLVTNSQNPFLYSLHIPLFKFARSHAAIGKPIAASLSLWMPHPFYAIWDPEYGIMTKTFEDENGDWEWTSSHE